MKKILLAAVAVASFTAAAFFSARPAPEAPAAPAEVPVAVAPQATSSPDTVAATTSELAEVSEATPAPSSEPAPSPAPTPTPKPAPAPTPTPEPSGITLADVALHATEADCWTSINGNVYDVTAYFGHHPGGDRNILKLCGKDGTSAFDRQHGDSSRPNAVLDGFIIGTLSN